MWVHTATNMVDQRGGRGGRGAGRGVGVTATAAAVPPSSSSYAAMEDPLKAYECGVCLEVPEGEVHQCHSGHFVCLGCWQTIQRDGREIPSRLICPVCRDPLPVRNRSLIAQHAIAQLLKQPATCETCGMRMTLGELRKHEGPCREQREQRQRLISATWRRLASLLRRRQVAAALLLCRQRLAAHLKSYSDAYLEHAMRRHRLDSGRVLPLCFADEDAFELRRREGAANVVEEVDQADTAVSLTKVYEVRGPIFTTKP